MAERRILVVEDEGIVALDMQNRLRRLGYFVCALTASGEDGVSKAAELRPDLVLMDINLRGDMDGVAAAHEIRARLDIPVVYVTAYSDDATLERAKITEPFGYILKPFEDRGLRATIEMALFKHEAEQKLKESEAHLRAIYESAMDGMFVIDTRGRYVDVNPAGCRMFGYTRDEILGADLRLLVSPEHAEEALAMVPYACREGGRISEACLRKKDGSNIWVEMTVTPLRVNGEELALGIKRDVTERKQADEALRRYAERLEAMEQAAAVVNSTLDLDHVLDHILEQVERVVAGDTFNIMLVEGDLARIARWRGYDDPDWEEHIRALSVAIDRYPKLVGMMQTGDAVVVSDTTADPGWVPTESQGWLRSYVGAPIQVGGATVGFVNVDGKVPGQFDSEDARHLKVFANHAAIAIENARLYQELHGHAERLEQRVQERTAQFQAQYARLDATLRSTADGIVVTGAAGDIREANPVANAWLTHTLSPEDAARLRETIQDLACQACDRPEALLELTGLDLELRASPLSDLPAEESAAVVAIHDVSELKALDRMKTRFVTNISHELRTPVTTIKLYTYLMGQHPEAWGDYLAPLKKEVDHQAGLVDGILEVSRIDAGRLEMEPCATCLNGLARAVVADHRVLAESCGLTLECCPCDPDPTAWVDPGRMTQVLNNLVENSIHYTPEGGEVEVSVGMEEAEGRGWAVVTVTDTGMGIPEEDLPHIFERFFRGEKPRQMQISGTGLGLAIAKEIVELHGGKILVQSQPDRGSTFTVRLPLVQ